MVEKFAPVQLTHCVLSPLGPVPAAQAEHVVRSELTTDGGEHPVHWTPNADEVVPAHGTHNVLTAFGSSPGAHFVQL